ncbi:MAG TPA: CvpA family protein [Saprospiraceae bacterium]|nr:CvpA family protein [Saprospiraceae bacterium]
MIFDIIVICLIALGFYLGYNRGLIKTVFDTLSLFIAVLAALKLSPIVINLLQSILKISPAINFVLGIVITFIGIVAIIRFVGRKLENVFEAANINFINKIAGGALQGLFFAILISYIMYFGANVGFINKDIQERSLSYKKLEVLPSYTQAGINKLKPVFKSFWDKTIETMDAIKEKADGTDTKKEL